MYARARTFQPRNFTGWGNEGVKVRQNPTNRKRLTVRPQLPYTTRHNHTATPPPLPPPPHPSHTFLFAFLFCCCCRCCSFVCLLLVRAIVVVAVLDQSDLSDQTQSLTLRSSLRGNKKRIRPSRAHAQPLMAARIECTRGRNDINNGYLEHLTRTGPKRLHIL